MPLPNFDNLPTLPPNLIERLLTADELTAQATLLREADLLHANGLAALLEEADRLAGNDPSKTWKLAELATRVADAADAPAAHPRAAYLRGYVHAMRGQFGDARAMVETARAGYESLGMELEALRTNVGLMNILVEMGEFQNALDTGQDALDLLEHLPDAPRHSIERLKGLIHQNRGVCFEKMSQHNEALLEYEAAEPYFQRLNMYGSVANTANNRGLIFLAQGFVQRAILSFEKARSFYQEAKLPLLEAQTLINLGEVYSLSGSYTQSLATFEKAYEILQALDELSDHIILLRHVGDAYLALNLHGESLDAYRRAIPFLESAGFSHHLAHVYWSVGIALTAQKEFEEARQAFDQAAAMFRQQQNPQLLSAVLLEQSALETARGRTESAAALVQEALTLLANSDYPIQTIYAYLRSAELALLTAPPNLAQAETLLNAAQPLVETLALPHLRYRLQGRWGQLHRQRGDGAAAERALLLAIDEIEALRSTLVQERMRASFLDDKLSIYQELMELYLDRGNPEQAFQVAERSKSRALADLLSGAIQTQVEAITDERQGDTAAEPRHLAQLRALLAELNAIYNEMLNNGSASAGEDESRSRTISPHLLKERAVELEQSISRLQIQSSPYLKQAGKRAGAQNSHFPPRQPIKPQIADPLLSPPLTAAASAVDSPDPEIALLVFHVIDAEILAFIQIGGQTHVLRHLCTTDDVQPLLQRLAAQWSRFQAGQRFAQRHQQQMERSACRVLGALYDLLMRPVMKALAEWWPNDDLSTAGRRDKELDVAASQDDKKQGARKLAIVPHGLLHQLPFHALHDGERYLLERCAISYAPSATVFGLSQQRPLALHGTPLVMGVPDARIPAAAAEVERVAAHLHVQQLAPQALVGEAATLERLSRYSEGSLLHLACHGLFRSDNPMFSALKLQDGWLTANDAAQLRLPPSLVTLSACESGRSGGRSGSEILGLPYAFLSAGASSLLVSGWLVQDDATALLMDSWYAQLAPGVDLAEALRQAQLQVKARYPHPYYWAPFLLVGKRRVD